MSMKINKVIKTLKENRQLSGWIPCSDLKGMFDLAQIQFPLKNKCYF